MVINRRARGQGALALKTMRGGLIAGVAGCLFLAAPAAAEVPETLADPSNCTTIEPADGYSFVKCDDGIPAQGGETANPDGALAVTVPAKYRGYARLPRKADDATEVPGADSRGNVALDVDVSLPSTPPPRKGYPLVFLMHGCCSGNKASWEAESFDAAGEKWHYSNAWFAARGYAVVTYTARGFVNGENRGSTGQSQLDSREYEINDYQDLACQVMGAQGQFREAAGHRVKINRRRVVTTGGSYGGGFSWLAMTDPTWRCPAHTDAPGKRMRLRVSAPKYGWTDLAYSLVPTGAHMQEPGKLPDTRGCDTGPRTFNGEDCTGEFSPVGMPKRSIVAGLYASGTTGVPPGSPHTTFPPEIDQAIVCLNGTYPPETDPSCDTTVQQLLPAFLRERSAYYQGRFFRKIAAQRHFRVPVFNAATFTDPLFTPVENRRMLNRLRQVVPDYPIQVYHGDYQHFTQNKAKEWGDLCGGDHHVCTDADYTDGYNAAPAGRERVGVTSRLDRFIDHYAHPRDNRREPRPDFDVTASLQICPETASAEFPADEPGPTFSAPTFEQLAPNVLELDLVGTQTTTSTVPLNPHALNDDPVGNLASNGGACPVETVPAGPGVAVYTGDPLDNQQTMIGATRVTATFDPLAPPGDSGLQLNARLYDVFPGDSALMVDRGPRRLTPEEAEAGKVTFELHGNGWRFPAGHSIRIELTQDDEPFLVSSDVPSSLTLQGVRLKVPVR